MFALIDIALVVAGFVLLVWGADRFVFGAAGMARTLGVSPLIIGLVIVGFGTSAPEILVGGVAAWAGNTGLAIGNALGSNITNIGLVLGTTALIYPLSVHSDVLRREFPVLLLVMSLVVMLFLDGELGRLDGILLLVGMGTFIYWMVHLARQSRTGDPMTVEFEQEIPAPIPLGKAIFWLLLGLVVLLVGARLVVLGAVSIAQALGVSDLVIGLTIVAIGTSLPELAATLMSAHKGEDDLAVGNIIGSNLFNLLGVLGVPAAINPAAFDILVMTRDMPVMIVLTLALYFMARQRRGQDGNGHIGRFKGGILLAGYLGYLGVLYQTTAT